MPGRRPPASPLARLERQVAKLVVAVEADRKATAENSRRLDTLNLNGSTAALHKLAENADSLIQLAPLAGYITTAVEQRREREVAMRWLGRVINPFTSTVGKVVWLVASAIVGAVAWKSIPGFHFH